MPRRFPILLTGLLVALVAALLPARAARPILDYHRFDPYFSLFARDSYVPWQPTTVRIDTYSGAAVNFAVYKVDPADVIVAGANTQPRTVDTRRMHALAEWKFTPPGGFRFQSNDVAVPLAAREGFFVVEARRGNVGQQVWIDRTRIGLLAKETAGGLVLYGADLGTGKPLKHLRVSFVVNGSFAERYAGADGTLRWRGNPRPVFALAQWGGSVAFLSFLPQPPLPGAIVAVKTDSAVIHAGGAVHVVGFSRSRNGASLRAASGYASVILRSARSTIAQNSARLDPAGAFTTSLRVPASSAAGEYTVIATVDGATAGTSVHVDANADGLSLSLAPLCAAVCDPAADVPVAIRAMRNGAPASGVQVHVVVIRSPHVYAGQAPDSQWGMTQWCDVSTRTDAQGRALVLIPHPADALASTYGIHASSGGASADTRVVVPTSSIALNLHLERADIGAGAHAGFDVTAADLATGKPVAGLAVRVQLLHGASVQEQVIMLDDRGHAHGSFSDPQTGSNLIVARAVSGNAESVDAAQLEIEPQTMQTQDAAGSGEVTIALDRKAYATGDQLRLDAAAPGAQGAAILTLDSGAGTEVRVVAVDRGHADATFRLGDPAGVISAGAAFVHAGTLDWNAVPIQLDGPGRPVLSALILDKASYVPGATATATLAGVRRGEGTLIVRITKGAPSGSALFENAPDLLAMGAAATQDSAANSASWHASVNSTGAHALVETFARRTTPPANLSMADADTASVYWKIDRRVGNAVRIPVPSAAGRYVLSLLKIDNDGRVIAVSGDLIVQ